MVTPPGPERCVGEEEGGEEEGKHRRISTLDTPRECRMSASIPADSEPQEFARNGSELINPVSPGTQSHAPAHTKHLGWHLEFEFRVENAPADLMSKPSCVTRYCGT